MYWWTAQGGRSPAGTTTSCISRPTGYHPTTHAQFRRAQKTALEVSRLTEAISPDVARRERLNRELEIAREVQDKLFPQKLPIVPGLD